MPVMCFLVRRSCRGTVLRERLKGLRPDGLSEAAKEQHRTLRRLLLEGDESPLSTGSTCKRPTARIHHLPWARKRRCCSS